MAQLTQRQRDVLRLLEQGYSQKEAAARLGMAYGTIRKHSMAMRQRTNARSTMEIVARAAAERRAPGS